MVKGGAVVSVFFFPDTQNPSLSHWVCILGIKNFHLVLRLMYLGRLGTRLQSSMTGKRRNHETTPGNRARERESS
jgi:hypothetical protein